MPKVRFGLYLIPEQGSFYQAGSSVVGYDIRAQQKLPAPEYIQPHWQAVAKEYGFHVTITDAIGADSNKLPMIADQVRQILSCLRTTNQYICTKDDISFWGSRHGDAAIVLKPNRSVELLHDIMVAMIHPLGTSSGYSDTLARNPNAYFRDSPAQVNKTRQFYAPYIFDEFTPHFTCVNPFVGSPEQRRTLEGALREQFADFNSIEFQTLCFVAQELHEAHFKIVEEFDLHAA